jgi:hypothetical protein
MALDPGTSESDGEFQAVFENTLGFPMDRRPIDSLRRMDTQTPDEIIHGWFTNCQVSIGSQLSELCRKGAERLIWTWRDRFCNSIVELPATDLIAHRIPTIRCKPVRIKYALFTQWQRKHLPGMLKAGIIDWVNSPWSAKTEFPGKKNSDLQMVHAFCPINDVTIKSSYPMKRIQPILNSLSSSTFKTFWYADGANGYWAIPMWKSHAFKADFSTVLGQFAYLWKGHFDWGASLTTAGVNDCTIWLPDSWLGQRSQASGLKDRVHLDDLRVFVPRKKEGIGDDGVQCVDMPWDGRRTLSGSVWKDVC